MLNEKSSGTPSIQMKYTKYYCKYSDALDIYSNKNWVQVIINYKIYQSLTSHGTREYLHNLKKAKCKWYDIYEENNHSTQ